MDDLMRNALINAHRGTNAPPPRVPMASRGAFALGRAIRMARDHSRWALGSAVIGGSIVSLLLGMTIAGAFSGVDVALPPSGSVPASPRIEYAAPNSSHSHDAPRPATSGKGATTTTASPTTTAAPRQGSPATATPSTTAPSGSSSGSGGSTATTTPATTTPPTTTPPTTTPPSTTPSTTVPSGPIGRILG